MSSCFLTIRRSSQDILVLIGIHSMQDWTATRRLGVTKKGSTERLNRIRNLFSKKLQLIGVC